MKKNIYWELFLETGSPQAYLMYRASRLEAKNVSDDSGDRPQSNRLQ